MFKTKIVYIFLLLILVISLISALSSCDAVADVFDSNIDSYVESIQDDISLLSDEKKNQVNELIDELYNTNLTDIKKIKDIKEQINAILQEKTCVVSFDTAGGTEISPVTVEYGKKIMAPEAPTKNGHTFDGWYVGDERWSFIGYVITEDITLTAHWITAEYTVTFDSNGGTSVDPLAVEHGDKIAAPDAPTKTNYKFEGWYLDDSAWSFQDNVVTRDITLTAKWTRTHFLINFDYNDGSGTIASVNLASGTTIFTLPSPVRYGYTLDGWYIGDIKYTSFTIMHSDVTLTAKWIQNSTSTDTPSDDVTPDSWWDDIAYNKTNLIFQMTDCSHNQELSSECGRYLAGTKNTKYEAIDELVKQRNDAAYEMTNVTVEYRYYPDNSSSYGFGGAYKTILEEMKQQSTNSPDMYCNFMTDMLILSLKGQFANLYSLKRGEGDYRGANYFNLKDPGYMADLMGSLTLSTEKIYVVASDYFIDLIRAFFVVPVNVSLYNEIAETMIDDFNEDGYNDINDMIFEVKNGDWTYDRLAEYCAAIHQNGDDTSQAGASIDDRLGIGLGVNGLVGAGLVYTSSVTFIQKMTDEDGKGTDYLYPAENQKLLDLTDAIARLITKKGVMVIDTAAAQKVGERTALLGVRKQFTTDRMLFGGIIMVGSLEYPEYQAMKENGGFSVVPVPLYQKYDKDTGAQEEYLTQIHVVGRAGGVSAKSTKFVQCSAFLQYQSSRSTDILNQYYDFQLAYGVVDGVTGNVEMLQYIRNHVRTSFDKLFEDAVGMTASDGAVLDENTRWHAIISGNYFNVTNMRQLYTELRSPKQISLDDLEEGYKNLPD